jgi:hypothetical protein
MHKQPLNIHQFISEGHHRCRDAFAAPVRQKWLRRILAVFLRKLALCNKGAM